jgi:chemotaxis protein CheD
MKEYKKQHFPKCPSIYRENTVYLYPGEYHFAIKPTLIHTLLGSCVAVVLFDQAHQYGAMCHAVLDSASPSMDTDDSKCYKYMDCVLDEMISSFSGHGVPIDRLIAKVFGGAQMLLEEEKKMLPSCRVGVGEKNALMAVALLKEYGCMIESTDLGGYKGRKIYFLSHTGDVFLKRI